MNYPKRAVVWATVAMLALGASAGCSPQEPKREPPGSVAILVVDDFDVIRPGGPKETRYRNSAYAGKNCTFQSQEVGGKGATGTSIPTGMSHGAYVFDQVAEMLDRSSGPGKLGVSGRVDLASINLASRDWARHARRWTYAGHGDGSKGDQLEILVVGIDTDEYETRDVTSRINTAIDELRGKQITRFVVNLSFQIAPCDPNEFLRQAGAFLAGVDGKLLLAIYQAIVESEYREFKDDLETLGAQYDLNTLWTDSQFAELHDLASGKTPGKVIPPHLWIYLFHGILAGLPLPPDTRSPAPISPPANQAYDRLKDDPLIKFLQNNSATVVPVGAAGNGLLYDPPGKDTTAIYTFDFPFAPALWDRVVSVSAADMEQRLDIRQKLESYSNSGEVKLFGTVELTKSNADTQTQWMIPPDRRRDDLPPPQGTSFAAPRMSALQAIYRMNGGPVKCQGNVPPLGYTALGAAGSGTYPNWENLTLTDATTKYCPDFIKTATL